MFFTNIPHPFNMVKGKNEHGREKIKDMKILK
jgi:hypothetical protein